MVIGYFSAISSNEGSWNTTNGGTPFCLATFLRKSLSISNSTGSATEVLPLLGSSGSSSKVWSSVIIKEVTFLRYSLPFSVMNITPYVSMSLRISPFTITWRKSAIQ